MKIAVAQNPATAEFVKQALGDAGVPCLLKNTDPVGVLYGSLWTSPFAVQVFVLEGDEAAAQAALAACGIDTSAPIALPAARRQYKRRPGRAGLRPARGKAKTD